MHALLYLLPGAIIGALITYALPFIIWIPKYLWEIYKGKTAPEGIWYSYHWTRKDQLPHVRFTRWRIRRNFRGQLSVRSWERDASPAYKRSNTAGKASLSVNGVF